jgi:hypothetical protein
VYTWFLSGNLKGRNMQGIWNNIKMDLKDAGDEDVNYVYLMQCRDQWLTLVNTEPSGSKQVR